MNLLYNSFHKTNFHFKMEWVNVNVVPLKIPLSNFIIKGRRKPVAVTGTPTLTLMKRQQSLIVKLLHHDLGQNQHTTRMRTRRATGMMAG